MKKFNVFSITMRYQLRAASLYFHRGLRRCFTDDYELLFDSPVSRRLDNTVLGHSPPHIPAAG